MLISFLLPVLAWVLLKPLLDDRQQSRREHNELLDLKRDPDLFRGMLTQQPKMPPIPAALQPIVLGNPDAEHTITMITNPFCSPCAKTHAELEQLISRNTNVNVGIVFASNGPDATRVAMHILALIDQRRAVEALTNWYAQTEKKYDAWASRYPVDTEKQNLVATMKLYDQWCRLTAITGTPTLFVNGYQLPVIYSTKNLRWLIDYLPTTTPRMDLIKSQ